MRVVVTEAAIADLVGIGRAIGADSPGRAETFVQELQDRCLQLGALPNAFPLIPRWEHKGVRRRVHGNHLIFYRVGEQAVEILHVAHGARDIDALSVSGRLNLHRRRAGLYHSTPSGST